MLWLTAVNSVADSTAIAVLYPDVRAPYDRIFNDIVMGIKQGSKVPVFTYALKADDERQKVAAWLQQSGLATVISLGSRGKAITGSLPSNFKVIVGASILSDDNAAQGHIGISLSPAPGKMFAKLKELAPSVKTVNVVYHPQTNGWLVALAKRKAVEHNLQLMAAPAADVREAALLYKKLLAENVRGKSAIWLLQGDPTLDERSLLPTILSKAWNKNHVVFSSNPSHVKRGALFSLFPDNIGMGISLSDKAQQVVKGKNRDIDPLEDLLIAVNIRTAEHLALKISRAQARKFNLVFPLK
ncbi:MAG: ABC transporter substrate binding protein [Pseudomonadales bacterium]